MAAKKKTPASDHDCSCTRTAGAAEEAFGAPFAALSDEEKHRLAMQQIEADPFLGALIAAAREIDAREAAAALEGKKKRSSKSAPSTSARKAPR